MAPTPGVDGTTGDRSTGGGVMPPKAAKKATRPKVSTAKRGTPAAQREWMKRALTSGDAGPRPQPPDLRLPV